MILLFGYFRVACEFQCRLAEDFEAFLKIPHLKNYHNTKPNKNTNDSDSRKSSQNSVTHFCMIEKYLGHIRVILLILMKVFDFYRDVRSDTRFHFE